MDHNEKDLTTEEKIQIIETSARLNDVPISCLPAVHMSEYYFVSYSHKDYKEVYADILRLQQCGLNIWYDRGMEAGKSWYDVAENYIDRFSCLGVIFYLSANSIVSDAIHKEIELTAHYGKSYCTINIPLEGASAGCPPVSGQRMLDYCRERGMIIDEEKYQYISRHFGEDVIFVDYFSPPKKKAELITNAMKRRALLKFKELYSFGAECEIAVQATNDMDVREIGRDDFACRDEKGVHYPTEICPSAFANCRKLKTVVMPDSVKEISPYAFYNCFNLQAIQLPESICIVRRSAFENCTALKEAVIPENWARLYEEEVYIEDRAFADCETLEKVIIPDGFTGIGDSAFYYCKKLREIRLGAGLEKIGEEAFGFCKGLQYMEIPQHIAEIADYTFELCSSLSHITLPDGLKRIGRGAFLGCFSLRQIVLPKNLEYIGPAAFNNGKYRHDRHAMGGMETGGLETVYYKGGRSEWRSIVIDKENDFFSHAQIYYYSEEKPEGAGMFWHYQDNAPAVWEENRELLFLDLLDRKAEIEKLDLDDLLILLGEHYQIFNDKNAVSLVIEKITNHSRYIFSDRETGRKYELTLEFFDMNGPSVGDVLVIYKDILRHSSFFSFSADLRGPGRTPGEFRRESGDVVILSARGKNTILKRLYG